MRVRKGRLAVSAAALSPSVLDTEDDGDAGAAFDCLGPCWAEQAKTNSAAPMIGRHHLDDDEINDPSLRSGTLCIT